MKSGDNYIESLIYINWITIKSYSFVKIPDTRSRLYENHSVFKDFNCSWEGITILCFQ